MKVETQKIDLNSPISFCGGGGGGGGGGDDYASKNSNKKSQDNGQKRVT